MQHPPHTASSSMLMIPTTIISFSRSRVPKRIATIQDLPIYSSLNSCISSHKRACKMPQIPQGRPLLGKQTMGPNCRFHVRNPLDFDPLHKIRPFLGDLPSVGCAIEFAPCHLSFLQGRGINARSFAKLLDNVCMGEHQDFDGLRWKFRSPLKPKNKKQNHQTPQKPQTNPHKT